MLLRPSSWKGKSCGTEKGKVYGQEKKKSSFTSDPIGNKKGGTKTNREEVEKKNHVCRTRGG
jgi:hypothetical protein